MKRKIHTAQEQQEAFEKKYPRGTLGMKAAKSKALEHAKSGGLIGKLKSQIAESEKARSGNWRDLLGKHD